MKRLFKRIAFCALFVLLASCREPNFTVIVSLDGSRWDYPDMYEMPFFDSLAREGVKACVEPSFPSSTFPNHYTIATGCVPDHNGMVNNSFRDPDTGGHYSSGDSATRYNPKYYLKEPIWITAQRQGLSTGNIYWFGGDVAVNGTFPTYYRRWTELPHWDFGARVDEAVRLMSLPRKERPRLLMVYFDEPDHTGHYFGPQSSEMATMAQQMDSLMHVFYLRLMRLPHARKINFILAGDHGMTELSPERFIDVADVVKPEWVTDIVGEFPTSIFCQKGYVDTVYNALQGIPHLQVYRHGACPPELNYGTSDRLGDLIAAPDLGWQFSFGPSHHVASHGFDPREKDMHVAFRAIGPDFKQGYEAPEYADGSHAAFKNIDLYLMLCHLLDITPAPVDGEYDRIKNILRKP